MPLIRYARISTEDQTALPQVQDLRIAGCVEVVEEQASGGSRTRPVLARVLDQLRAAKAFVREGLLPEAILARATAVNKDDCLPAIVAGIKGAVLTMTLHAIRDRLKAMRERTPLGRDKWQPSTVKMLLERAGRFGLI